MKPLLRIRKSAKSFVRDMRRAVVRGVAAAVHVGDRRLAHQLVDQLVVVVIALSTSEFRSGTIPSVA